MPVITGVGLVITMVPLTGVDCPEAVEPDDDELPTVLLPPPVDPPVVPWVTAGGIVVLLPALVVTG